ncbi:Uncharacterized protein PCOAH_00028420 [Plasmodium coatneyi]|uniref:Plasmodium RESA N-terminal domain-containing protein n=1 Tax=Plasmodium coatneyi TaxID=208452 RepID=A0A1B1E0I4_9APIC|nr:Uncharacterized protein PCOAH_00028420 [Plasmodium coatneyi]ANQ08544.1 Uncharacterized protein PCOAH_00028420 [Plasmodium coatneyi]
MVLCSAHASVLSRKSSVRRNGKSNRDSTSVLLECTEENSSRSNFRKFMFSRFAKVFLVGCLYMFLENGIIYEDNIVSERHWGNVKARKLAESNLRREKEDNNDYMGKDFDPEDMPNLGQGNYGTGNTNDPRDLYQKEGDPTNMWGAGGNRSVGFSEDDWDSYYKSSYGNFPASAPNAPNADSTDALKNRTLRYGDSSMQNSMGEGVPPSLDNNPDESVYNTRPYMGDQGADGAGNGRLPGSPNMHEGAFGSEGAAGSSQGEQMTDDKYAVFDSLYEEYLASTKGASGLAGVGVDGGAGSMAGVGTAGDAGLGTGLGIESDDELGSALGGRFDSRSDDGLGSGLGGRFDSRSDDGLGSGLGGRFDSRSDDGLGNGLGSRFDSRSDDGLGNGLGGRFDSRSDNGLDGRLGGRFDSRSDNGLDGRLGGFSGGLGGGMGGGMPGGMPGGMRGGLGGGSGGMPSGLDSGLSGRLGGRLGADMGNKSENIFKKPSDPYGQFESGAPSHSMWSGFLNQDDSFGGPKMSTSVSTNDMYPGDIWAEYKQKLGDYSGTKEELEKNRMGEHSSHGSSNSHHRRRSSSERTSSGSRSKSSSDSRVAKYSGRKGTSGEEYDRRRKESKILEQASSKHIRGMIDKLGSTVNLRDMFYIFNCLINHERRKYIDMEEGTMLFWDKTAKSYGLPDYYKNRQWMKAFDGMTKELFYTEKKLFDRLYQLLQHGSCSRSGFIQFLKEVKYTCHRMRKEMENQWKQYLSSKVRGFW